MSLNDTPSGERAHIVFFGVRNAGKSSLVNALTSQTVSVVSDVAGTTTDPVRKAMELAPAGPVLIVDTPGIDDAGDVGDLRVQRAEAALNEANVAVLVMDATCGMTSFDDRLLATFQTRRIPHVIAENKADLLAESGRVGAAEPSLSSPSLGADASNGKALLEGGGYNAVASAETDGASVRAARVRVSARTGEGVGGSWATCSSPVMWSCSSSRWTPPPPRAASSCPSSKSCATRWKPAPSLAPPASKGCPISWPPSLGRRVW